MEYGSPIYRRETDRSVFGIMSRRQLFILLIGVGISILINRSQPIDESQYSWEIKATPLQAQQNEEETWGALPDDFVTSPDGQSSFEPYYIEDFSVGYYRNEAFLSWPENTDHNREIQYEVFLNGELVDTITYTTYVFPLSKLKSDNVSSDAPSIQGFITVAVLLLAFGIAFLEIKGAPPERYVFRIVKQYFGFQSILKLPVINLPIGIPYRKQTYFRLSKKAIPEVQFKPKAQNSQYPLLKKVQPIERIAATPQSPILFKSSLQELEIVHNGTSFYLKRAKNGGIEIVVQNNQEG